MENDKEKEKPQKRVWGERSTTIQQIGAMQLPSPVSALTVTEQNKGRHITGKYEIPVTFENEVLEINTFYGKKEFDKIKLSNVQPYVDQVNASIEKSSAKAYVFRPQFGSKITDIKKVIEFTYLVSAQSNASFTVVHESPSYDDTVESLKHYNKQMKDDGIKKGSLLYMSLDQEPELYGAKYLLAEKETNGALTRALNLKYRMENVDFMAQRHSVPNFLRYLAGVPKSHKKTALMTLLALGADVVSLQRKFGFSDEPVVPPSPEVLHEQALTNATRYYEPHNSYYGFSEFSANGIVEDECTCVLDREVDNKLLGFYADYDDALYSAVSVHNSIAIDQKIKQMREKIGQGKIWEYVMARPRIRTVAEEYLGLSISQRKL